MSGGKRHSGCPQLNEWLAYRAAPDPSNDDGAYLFGASTLLPYRLAEEDEGPTAAEAMARAVADLAAAKALRDSLE